MACRLMEMQRTERAFLDLAAPEPRPTGVMTTATAKIIKSAFAAFLKP